MYPLMGGMDVKLEWNRKNSGHMELSIWKFHSPLECSPLSSFFSTLKPPLPSGSRSCMRNLRTSSIQVSAGSYQKFIHFALDETNRHTNLIPSPLQERFSSLTALDGKTELKMLSFQAPKIRLLRSFSVEVSGGIQVLDFAVFPEPEFDLPIFCANFFTTADTNIVVLDLNPLHDVINKKDYRNKYYKSLIPLGFKYAELLPWGGAITGESLRFFSPIVIWTKFSSSQDNHNILYSAFMDYYKAWLVLMDQAAEEMDASRVSCNQVAQHRYLTWREEKDPGHHLLRKLIGETRAKDLMKNFLFSGINELGSETFLDYFPEYKSGDGTVNSKRSIVGKSYEKRPWNSEGEFIGKQF